MGNISSPLTARATAYRGVEMRSRLEATWAAEFDAMVKDPIWHLKGWEYEPNCFASEQGQYLPDFKITFDYDGDPTYVDIKGVLDDPLPVMERMEIILASEPDATLQIRVGQPPIAEPWWMGRTLWADHVRWFGWSSRRSVLAGSEPEPFARIIPLDGQPGRTGPTYYQLDSRLGSTPN
jgi:hypothetical protein